MYLQQPLLVLHLRAAVSAKLPAAGLTHRTLQILWLALNNFWKSCVDTDNLGGFHSKKLAELSLKKHNHVHFFSTISKPEHRLKRPPSVAVDCHLIYSLVVILAEMISVQISWGAAVSINPAEMMYQPLSWNVEQLFPIALMETALMMLQSGGTAHDIIIILICKACK